MKVGRRGDLLTDLSKAFDCLPHNLLIAKLNAYDFDNKAGRFVYDCLTCRKQRFKTSDTYSSWQEILSGVPQGSILEPLLFNIDICDLFFIIEVFDIANYADENTPYLSGKNVEEVLNGLENVSSNLFQWFTENELKGHASKCHLLIRSGENGHLNRNMCIVEIYRSLLQDYTNLLMVYLQSWSVIVLN